MRTGHHPSILNKLSKLIHILLATIVYQTEQVHQLQNELDDMLLISAQECPTVQFEPKKNCTIDELSDEDAYLDNIQ